MQINSKKNTKIALLIILLKFKKKKNTSRIQRYPHCIPWNFPNKVFRLKSKYEWIIFFFNYKSSRFLWNFVNFVEVFNHSDSHNGENYARQNRGSWNNNPITWNNNEKSDSSLNITQHIFGFRNLAKVRKKELSLEQKKLWSGKQLFDKTLSSQWFFFSANFHRKQL